MVLAGWALIDGSFRKEREKEKGEDKNKERNELMEERGENLLALGGLMGEELDCFKKTQRYCRLQLIMKYTQFTARQAYRIGDPNKQKLYTLAVHIVAL